MFNIFKLFKKVYCDICGKRIKGKPNRVLIAEDSDSCYYGNICDECAYMIDDYQIKEK
jgi:ribosome-binding protein aMBF1 (putative translation factor)